MTHNHDNMPVTQDPTLTQNILAYFEIIINSYHFQSRHIYYHTFCVAIEQKQFRPHSP